MNAEAVKGAWSVRISQGLLASQDAGALIAMNFESTRR